MIVKKLTANSRGSPGYACSSFIAGLCISCHCGTEALTVSTTVTSTWVSHTSIVVRRGVHLKSTAMCCKIYRSCMVKHISLPTKYNPHILLVVYPSWIYPYLVLAGCEDITVNDAALFLGPRRSVRVGGTWVHYSRHTWAAWWNFPAVSKFHWINNCRLGSSGEVIVCVAIIVSTQTTHLPLKKRDHELKWLTWQGYTKVSVTSDLTEYWIHFFIRVS
jgi:hypothetical protein